MKLSVLAKTWLIDLDGTVLKHNAHLSGPDRLLPGVRALWAKFRPEDRIVLLSARDPRYEALTRRFFEAQGLRFDQMIFGLPTGERILINDKKPSGLETAIAVNLARDGGVEGVEFSIDPAL